MRKRKKTLWTDANVDRLKELVAQKKSYPEIAEYFGTTSLAVKLKVHRLGITRGKIVSEHSKLKEIHEKQNLSKASLARRILVLRGEAVREENAEFSFTDEQLKSWLDSAKGCERFAFEVLGEKLQAYQKELIAGFIKYPKFCLVSGRQCGKDWLAGVYSIWLAITRPNTKILVVSPAQRQSDLLYNRILRWLASNDKLYFSVEKSTQEYCNFVNGSVIKSLPSTTFIRGESAVDLVILNEARDFLNGEDVLASVLPMMALTKGSLIMMSSPAGCIGILWDSFNSPHYKSIQLPSSVNKYIDANWLEQQRESMPANIYAMEFEARFQQTVDNFFPADLIDKCSESYSLTSNPNPERSYYLGIDWGRIVNSSVFTVVSQDAEKRLMVENLIEKVNVPLSAQVSEIEELHKHYHFSKIVVEYAGLSLQACEALKTKGLPIQSFKPTLQSKSEVYGYLKQQMETDKLTLPKNHTKLQHQLRTFRYQFTGSGMKLHGEQDDFCDSLAFAVWATKSTFCFAFA